MTRSTKRIIWPITALAIFVMFAAGCNEAAIKANQQQVQMQQAQIDKMQKEISALKAAQPAPTMAPAPATASSPTAASSGTKGACDQTVLRTATRRGGDSYSSGDLKRALGYYRDAVTACPGDPSAQLNLARTYEALGNRSQAIDHYRQAAAASGSGSKDQKAIEAARMALSRLTAVH